MKENSYVLHCYDNLVAMATSNNCIFSLAVYSSLSPCIMCVQYRGGDQYHGVFSTMGDILSTVGDIMSTVRVFSTVGDIMMHVEGYNEYRGDTIL